MRSPSSPTGRITKQEFLPIMASLCMACGATKWDRARKTYVPHVVEGMTELYFATVADVPAGIVKRAAEILIATTTFRGLPPAGALRDACVTAALGVRKTPGEAWEMVRKVISAVSIYDVDRSRKLIAGIPADLREIVNRVGWYQIKDWPGERAREWFLSEYAKTLFKDRQRMLLPGGWPSELTLPAPAETRPVALPFKGS